MKLNTNKVHIGGILCSSHFSACVEFSFNQTLYSRFLYGKNKFELRYLNSFVNIIMIKKLYILYTIYNNKLL